MSLQQVEHEIQANNPKGPRVSLAHVEGLIRSEFYFTAEDGILGESELGTKPASHLNFDQIMICILVTKDGHREIGINYGVRDRADYNLDMAKRNAREQAMKKIWDYEAYAVRQQARRVDAALS